MLQIITGKFFSTDDVYRTLQRGVLYTNYRTVLPFETPVGKYLPVEAEQEVATAIYEVEQRLEGQNRDGSRSILVAVSPHYLLQDFAAALSFELGAIFTPDVDLVHRLTQSRYPPMGVPNHPRAYVRRVFDAHIQGSPDDPERVRDFLSQLIALDRRSFNAAMRAIRRYIVGLHRIGDDLEVAYTLMVASIESLAQEFDNFVPTWLDLEPRRRKPLDAALAQASTTIAEAVRSAMLADEHLKLKHRFREFTLAHLTPAFFREEAQVEPGPAGRLDLEQALKEAYDIRSGHLHTLRDLPGLLRAVPSHRDIMPVEGKPNLTLHGLARIARHVIREFVARGRKMDREEYDYRSELPNVVTAPAAERYWIWRQESYSAEAARRYLAGFLSELATVLLKQPDARLTDIRNVLEAIEELARGVNRDRRLPMLTLYFLFHRHVAPRWHRPGWESYIENYSGDFDTPSIESLVAHVIVGQQTGWTPDELTRVRADYLRQRHHKHGLNVGSLFETAITLTVAEAYRGAGDFDPMRSLISEAVDGLPGHQRLIELERRTASEGGLDETIHWQAELLPGENALLDA